MKRLVLMLIALALAFASPAVAADLSVAPVYKAPVAPPPAAFSWTGFYIGGNGGYGLSCAHRSQNDPNAIGDPINGLPDGFGAIGRTVQLPSGHCEGGLGGAQLGYNQQFNHFVLGGEVDFDALSINGTANSSTNAPGGAGGFFSVGPGLTVCGVAPGCQGIRTEETSLRWLSTVRARAGLPILIGGKGVETAGADRVMLFATGGLAVGEVSTSGSVNIMPPSATASTWTGSASTTKAGYTVGGGIEYALLNNWTIKGEYLYFDLGTVSHPLNLTSCTAPALGCFATLGTISDKIDGSMVRGGLNYKF